MNTHKQQRQMELLIGLGFIVATFAYATGNSLLSDYLANPLNDGNAFLGAALEIVNSIAVASVGYLSYKRLKDYNKNTMTLYKYARYFEALILFIGTVSLWFLSTSAPEVQIAFRTGCFNVTMLVFGTASILYCLQLYKTRLTYQWLSLLGVIGYLSLTVYALLGLFHVPVSMFLFAPGGIFELVFPLVVMVRGFRGA